MTLYPVMTIISSESRATPSLAQPVFALVRATFKLEVKPEDSIRTVLPSTPFEIVPPKPESTTLVRDFILSFKELENYK